MDNPFIPLSTLKPPTSPQTLPKAGPKLKYKPIFRPRKIAAATESVVKDREANTTLESKNLKDCSIPLSPSQLDKNLNKGTEYGYPSTKRERLTSAPRLRITGELQTSVLGTTLQDSTNQKQCVESGSGLNPEQVVISAQAGQVLQIPSTTKTTEDIPQGHGGEVRDTKEKLGGITKISPGRKKIEVTTAATSVKPTHKDSVIPTIPPKVQRAIEPKPYGAAAIFLPQFLAAWGVLNKAIDEAIITLHANPAAGPATPLMVLNSLGSAVIGAAIINANIQPKEIKAAIENILLQYHHRRAKEAEDVARMLGFSEGGTTEEEADARMGDTTDDDSKANSEGMDEDLKIIPEAMEVRAGDKETTETDQSLSAMEITPTNGISTLGSSESNRVGSLQQDLGTQGPHKGSDITMDESIELIVTTEDMDLRGQEIRTVSQPTINCPYTNPTNADILMSTEISIEGNLFSSDITASLGNSEILEASIDLDFMEVYGVEPSKLHTDNPGSSRDICNTNKHSSIEAFCATRVSSNGELSETLHSITNDVDSNRDQATAKKPDGVGDTLSANEIVQCQSEGGTNHIDSLCNTEEVSEPHSFDIADYCSGVAVRGSTEQGDIITIPCTIKGSANPENSPKIEGFICGKFIDSVEEPNRIISTPKTGEVNYRGIDGSDDVNGMSGRGELECINGFDGSKQVEVAKSLGAMEPNNFNHQDREAGFVTSSKAEINSGSSHLGNTTNANYIKRLGDEIRTETATSPANMNEVDIFKCPKSTKDIGSDRNSGDTAEASSTSSLCIIERIRSIKSLSSNGDPEGTTARGPDATNETSGEILHRADKMGNFCSTVGANKFVDSEGEDEDEDEGWANGDPLCLTESRIWNWLAELPEQSEVEEEIKIMEEMRKREEARNHEKLTVMLESVKARQKSWEGVFPPRSNRQIAPAVKTIPMLAAQVTAAPEVITIPTVIPEHRVWPSVVLLSIWVLFVFLVGSWSALRILDLFQLCSPNTHLPGAPLSSVLLRLANIGLDLFHEALDYLGDVDLQQPVFLFALVLWTISRWDSEKGLKVMMVQFVENFIRLALGAFSLAMMVLMVTYTTTMNWMRYLALAHNELTTPNLQALHDIELGHAGGEIIVSEGRNSSLGLEPRVGIDTYLWGERTTEETNIGEVLVTLARTDTATTTPSLLAEKMCQRYTLGVGAGDTVMEGNGIFYSSLGLCLVSFFVWGRGSRRQLRWRSGRG